MDKPKKDVAYSLQQLQIRNGHTYKAGVPSYGVNFTRDSLIYGLLASDTEALAEQIAYCARYQGTNKDPLTGEEPGKIHHEFPGERINDLVTTYSACDTTALFLIALAVLSAEQTELGLLEKYSDNIDQAIAYIKSHVKDGLFWEDPSLADADRFATKVTYWKDSSINSIKPMNYPVVYSLAHFQNAAALRLIGQAGDNQEVIKLGQQMQRAGIEQLWSGESFVTVQTSDGQKLTEYSTDSLTALLFIEPEVLGQDKANLISKYSERIETESGYRCGLTNLPDHDPYHTRYIWVYEQALIHAGAGLHNLLHVQEVASGVNNYWRYGFPELIDPLANFKPAGNMIQLWSIGAYLYFKNPETSLIS